VEAFFFPKIYYTEKFFGGRAGESFLISFARRSLVRSLFFLSSSLYGVNKFCVLQRGRMKNSDKFFLERGEFKTST